MKENMKRYGLSQEDAQSWRKWRMKIMEASGEHIKNCQIHRNQGFHILLAVLLYKCVFVHCVLFYSRLKRSCV